ncbi:MAG: TonB-dependent receptor [Gemmatimonadota bacterium]|nr:TonB-dependent receptor [Gemmatimonadota bacterium]
MRFTMFCSLVAVATFALGSHAVSAQATGQRRTAADSSAARDSATARARRDTLEAVVVRATRAGGAPPTSQTTLDRETIERTYAGEDAPLALQRLTSVTATSDAGGFSGYSAIRLRGIDQTRLSISLDGVPLNDPEDQVLYFSNVPDFMASMASVRVQRGVGTSAFGTASYAGSLNFESVSPASSPRFAQAQLGGGSWQTGRASLQGATGLRGAWAGYGRLSWQETDGYREHSGNRARSGFGSVAWIGARDAIRFTGFAGRSQTQLAYYAPSEAELAADPRANPMSPLERDDFHQEMASVQHTRALSAATSITTTAYRNSAAGEYDVFVGSELWNFNLAHSWYGLLSTIAWSRAGLALSAGAHLSDYQRAHFLFVRPDLASRVYDNTGHKQEQSAFGKASWTRGAVDWHADVEVRRAAFRYQPTAGTPIGEPRIDWVFLNPKVGVSWRLRSTLTAYASLGRTGREPARSDLFAGADDVDSATAVEVLPLTRVRPEYVTDLEVGVRVARGTASLGINAFAMRFRDEIAPIGAIAITGSPLRQNVAGSERVGVELEGRWVPRAGLTFSANATAMRARIAEYTDAATATDYRDVPPLLTPALLAHAEAAWAPFARGEVLLALRHVSRAYLANDGNTALTIPAYSMVDAGITLPVGRQAIRLQVHNLTGATAYASGYTDGAVRYLFPIARRGALATLVLGF